MTTTLHRPIQGKYATVHQQWLDSYYSLSLYSIEKCLKLFLWYNHTVLLSQKSFLHVKLETGIGGGSTVYVCMYVCVVVCGGGGGGGVG